MWGEPPKAALGAWRLGLGSQSCLFPRPQEAPGQGLGGTGLSPRLQVVVELLRLGLQALEFLLNEVSQGFAHLHLRGRTAAGLQPSRAFARGPPLRRPRAPEGAKDSQGQLRATHSRLILRPEPLEHRQGTEGLPDQHGDLLQEDSRVTRTA